MNTLTNISTVLPAEQVAWTSCATDEFSSLVATNSGALSARTAPTYESTEATSAASFPRDDRSYSIATFEHSPPASIVHEAWTTDDVSVTATVSTVDADQSPWFALLRRELRIARRVLMRFDKEPTPARLSYVEGVLRACNDTSWRQSPASATARLIYLRSSLLERVSYAEWLKVRIAIAPNTTEFRVPSRFLGGDPGELQTIDSMYFDEVVEQSLELATR